MTKLPTTLFLTLAVALGSTLIIPSTAYAEVLPACGSEGNIKSALMLGIQERTGVSNQTVADLLSVESAQPLGIDKTDDSKTCRVVLHCDADKAKKMEKDIIGKHPLSQFCWSTNYLADTGNGALRFNVRPDGEGGYIIRIVTPEPRSPEETFFSIFSTFRPHADAAPPPSPQQVAPISPPSRYVPLVGQGPFTVSWEQQISTLHWQNVTTHQNILVYRIVVNTEGMSQTLEQGTGSGRWPMNSRWMLDDTARFTISDVDSVVFVTSFGTFEYRRPG